MFDNTSEFGITMSSLLSCSCRRLYSQLSFVPAILEKTKIKKICDDCSNAPNCNCFFIRFAQPKITSCIISNKNIRTLVKTQRETPYEFPHSINQNILLKVGTDFENIVQKWAKKTILFPRYELQKVLKSACSQTAESSRFRKKVLGANIA